MISKRYSGKVDGPAAAANAARWLRAELDLGLAPIESLAGLCEQCGQFVLVTELGGEGASAIDGDVAAAVVSVSGDPGRRRTTAAHELGHLVLGDEYSTDLGIGTSREAREAAIDAFAAELLLPVEAVRRAAVSTALTRAELVRLAAEYRTSWSLALRQARAAKAITQQEEKELRTCPPSFAEFRDSLGWTPQPDLDAIRVPPTFAHAVMTAYRNGRITSHRALELMHGQLESESDLPPIAETDERP